MSHVQGARIGVVIPAYRVANQITHVIEGIPSFVEKIIVVDDASPDDTADRVVALNDNRVILLRHDANQGVGGAMRTGFQESIRLGLDVVVKVDGDDQMDPDEMPQLLEPVLRGEADMAKGNRFHDFGALRRMPFLRVIGNAGLTFLVKLASGYWQLFDPTNGYFAIRTDVLEMLNLDRLPRRYFFESGFLIRLGIIGAAVKDVPIGARYGDEHSSLSVVRTLFEFPPRLCWGLLQRLFWRYVIYGFSPVTVFLILAAPLLVFGLWYGITVWLHSQATGVPATAGTVMLAAMPIIIGFQLVLQAIVVDIDSAPKAPLSSRRKSD
ncbi:MAG: glycosyltransferase family 2 protein [Phycisphaerales bacterium]|nr:glycosyltransferase family 2 protein [Phycisphaerales bacterium]